MSDEQKQQGVDLSGEYEVEQPKVAAQPKAKPAAQPVAQTPEEDGGVDLSQDYEVGGKALPGKPAVSTAETKKNPAYNDPTKESHPVGEFLSENPTVASGLEWFNKHVAQPPVHMGEEAGKIGGHMAKTAAMDVDQTMSNPGQVMNQLDPTASQPPQKNPVQEEQELAQYEKEHPVIAGIAHGIGEFTGGLVGNPTNWPFMASNTAPAFLKKAMAYGFGTQMAKGEYDTIKNLTTNWKDMSVEQRAAELTKLVPQTYFTAHAAADTGAPQAIHENVVAPAVRGAADVATKVAPTIPYAVGAIAGHLADHPYIGGLIGKLVIPKESVNNVLETGRLYGLSDEDAAAKWTQERATAATKAAKAAKESLDKFKASSTQGNPPHEYVDAYLKTKLAADEATYHAEEAKAAAAAAKKQTKGTVTEPVPFHGPTPAEAEPEITTKSAVPAEPVLGKLGAPRTPPTVSPAHATTTIPQEPTATPNTPYGQIKLPGGEPVGTQRLLTEGTPEGPQVPKGGLPKINLPEAKPETPKAASKPERGNLRDLKVDETGKVVEKDPEGERLHQLLIESLKNTKGNENFPAAKVEVDKPAVKQAEDNVEATKKPLEVAQQKYDAAVAEHNKYSASHAQGIDSPKPVKASLEKAKAELNEAQAHHDLAKEHLEKTKVEAPTDDRGGERRVAEEALPEGQEDRRQNERRVLQGMNERAFTEGHTGQGGENTIDTDAYAKAMEQARKELGPNASVKDVMKRRDEIVKPEAKGKTGDVGTQSREANPEPTRAEAKAKPVLPKEEPTGYTAKKEEVVPAGAEGREPIKSAAEYHPAVEQKINELSDENLKKLAQAHGLNPDEYDFKARDERRHRTERDQLAKDITEQIGEDEKINLGRAAEQAEKEPGFANRDQSAKARADRAEKLFPRLRGPVDQYGNPKVSGGAPDTVGTAEAAKSDTEHFANAKKELGANASISDVAKRAQELKDTHAQIAEHEKNGGSTFSSKGKDLNGTDKYSVGAYPDRTEQIDKLTPERLEEFKKKNSDVLSKEDHAVGTWKDPDTGKAVLDVAKTYADRDAAIAAGKAANQKAIYHLGGEGEIKTGGTGRVNEKGSPVDEFGNPTASGGSQSSGENKRTMFFDPDKLTPKKEELENAKLRMRESGKTPIEWAKEMKAKNPEPIKVTHQNGTYTIEDGHHRYLAATLLNDALKAEVTDKPSTKNAKGSPVDEFGNPTVSGGAPEKKLPTGDALIKKYGESNGDPKDLTFILKDGRGVANTGIEHDHMLGGRTDEKVPPRERFIAEGNIRVRPRQGAGGREVAMSIPESGVTADQLKYIQKMSPQLKSGAVMIEVGKPGGGYKAIPYGEASPEQLETVIRGLGPVLNDKGSPIDWNGNPTVSGGSPSAGTSTAKSDLGKVKGTDKEAAEYVNPKEQSTLKTDVGRKNFVDNMAKLPKVQELTDAAQQGAGERKWYQRSGQAFTALSEAAKDNPAVTKYFKPEMRDKFVNFIAALSPQQPVKMDMQEALHAWTKAVDLHTDGASDKQVTSMLHKELTMSSGKVNNALKALKGEPIWDDLRTKAFKVPSFGDNLNGFLDRVVNDGWMALFHGIENAGDLSKASLYHPMSVLTRVAAEHLNWEPAEAQAAIWSVIKTLTEKGTVNQGDIRTYSHDMADLLQHDPDIRRQVTEMGFNTNELDKQLAKHVEAKPEVTSGISTSGKNSLRKLVSRVQRLRPDALSEAKLKTLNEYLDRESEPEESGSTDFNPEDFSNEESSLEKLGKKKSPYGKIK